LGAETCVHSSPYCGRVIDTPNAGMCVSREAGSNVCTLRLEGAPRFWGGGRQALACR